MQKINFPSRTEFDQILRDRVNNYLKEHNIKPTGNAMMQIKGGIIFLFSIISYISLVFFTSDPWMALLLTFVLIQTQILLAFNVMHDAGHGSFSSKGWKNILGSFSLEFIGASSHLWKQKHNSLHHTYTNINGKDDDLDIGSLMRLSPEQQKKPWHRYQHIYAPFLYSLLSLYLLFYNDLKKMFTKKIGDAPITNIDKKQWFIFLTSKLMYVFYALAIPMFFHSPLVVLGYFLFAHFVFGVTISIVFQLAHIVKETDFPVPQETGTMPYSWSEHQLHTTCDFAPNNWFVTFYCGGLNYQVEHHLFHKISHIHYPKISKIIKETCAEFNKPYHVNNSFWEALASHFKSLKLLGTK